jgi:hypothetical protein
MKEFSPGVHGLGDDAELVGAICPGVGVGGTGVDRLVALGVEPGEAGGARD